MKLIQKRFGAAVVIPLSLICLNISAKTGTDIQVERSIKSTLNQASFDRNDWVHYQVEMEEKNGSPCCFMSRNRMGCELGKKSRGWQVTSNDQFEDSKVLSLYFQWENNQMRNLVIAGESCQVDTNDKRVTQLLGATQKQSVSFLGEMIESAGNSNRKERVLASLALHKGSEAHQKLVSLTKSKSANLKEEAIFWLGAARNEAGYRSLVDILDDKRRSRKDREKTLFALSENSDPRAVKKLLKVAKSSADDELRGESLFWLAQNKVPETIEIIEDVLNQRPSRKLAEKSVFALSQIETTQSWDMLKQLAMSHKVENVQEKAIFWLAHSSEDIEGKGEETLETLKSLISTKQSRNIQEQAVFAISQLEPEYSTKGLVSLIRTSKDTFVKKKAIFWLGQSDDPQAFEFIKKLLAGAD